MISKSPSTQAKQIEQEVNIVLRNVDLTTIAAAQRDNLLDLKLALANARIYASTYEISETREEQERNAKHGKLWLARANKRILTASEYNIFGPVDVASLSAQIDQLKSELK